MKMIDLKLPKRKKEELKDTSYPAKVEGEQWPYGLRLTFESEQVDKLPQLTKVKIGENIHVMGMGEVTSIRMNEEKEGKKRYSVEVQIQQIGVEGSSSKKESMGDAMDRMKKNRTIPMGKE